MPSTARGCHELSLLILIFIQTHVNLLHAKMVENANQKMETGNVIARHNTLVQYVRIKEIHVNTFNVQMEEHVFPHQILPFFVHVLQDIKVYFVMKKQMRKTKIIMKVVDKFSF